MGKLSCKPVTTHFYQAKKLHRYGHPDRDGPSQVSLQDRAQMA